ncbi:LysR family transcriptional regulator [Nonomuraea gerenzanensis]|uniref:Putative LysR-family transcriptional regulator n=1 Tax=Nonomuraea gerenzanensis TaxID=93944 RepID=A0A1M4EI82_9ACTN|nr:LysR family transcriptional regulator [Nonomuraea gerenzanensis]UBU10247.1 LysR family transcriptional regulator [Nonomuraea gerenzanensis]SBO98625.1 putative LysR-family transcriptional regulator [Nonomuraea gerenzanensis]
MDADISGMRAFVVTAEELHFGRAGARLFITQQALSKRIRRLEDALGAALFERTTRSIELTTAGRRFLPAAAEAVAAFDRAVEVVRAPGDPIRVDVYDERFTPLRLVREASERDPRLRVELSMRQGLAVALPALRRQEIDAAFGRAHDLPGPWPSELAHRLVHLEPLAAFVPEDHPLAGRTELRPADLRAGGIAMPDPAGAAEWRGYLERLAARFGAPLRFNAPAIGVRHLVEQFLAEKSAVGLGEMSIEAAGSGLRRIPIVDPVPLLPWSVVWSRRNPRPLLRSLLAQLRPARLPDPADPRSWVPDPDRAPRGVGSASSGLSGRERSGRRRG